MKKPVLMQRIEEQRGESVEAIIERLTEQGQTQEQIARNLGINYWTLRNWLLRLGAETRTVVVFRRDGNGE